MKVIIVLALALCAACAGSQPAPAAPPPGVEPVSPPATTPEPEPEPEAQMEYFSEDLETDDNLIPALQIGAQELDCALVAEEGQKVVYECPAALIVMVQSGTELRYVCEHATPEACQQLMGEIIDAVLAAAGGH